MGPVRVADDKKPEDKKKKKGLLSSLLSMFGRGGASAAGTVATGTATVATSSAVGGAAGIMGFLLSKTGIAAMLIGGAALATGIGMVGTGFLGGPPSSNGIKDQGFEARARAVRNVDDDEAPNHLQAFNEGTRFNDGRGGDQAGKGDAAASAKGSGSSGGSSMGAAASAVDAYGNSISKEKSSSFGTSSFGSNFGAGGGGGGGSGSLGSSNSSAVSRGVNSDTSQGGNFGGGSGGQIAAMRNNAQAPGAGGKRIALSAAGRASRGQLRGAAAMSKQAALSGNYEAKGALAGKAFNGGTSGGGSRTTVAGEGAGIGGPGLSQGGIAPPVNPNAIEKDIKAPQVDKPQVSKNDSCKEDNLKAMDPANSGPMTDKEYAVLKKTCDNKQKLADAGIALVIMGVAVMALNQLGKWANKQSFGTGSFGAVMTSIVKIAMYAMYAAIIVKSLMVLKQALDINSESPSLSGQAIAVVAGAGAVTIAAGVALVGALAEDWGRHEVGVKKQEAIAAEEAAKKASQSSSSGASVSSTAGNTADKGSVDAAGQKTVDDTEGRTKESQLWKDAEAKRQAYVDAKSDFAKSYEGDSSLDKKTGEFGDASDKKAGLNEAYKVPDDKFHIRTEGYATEDPTKHGQVYKNGMTDSDYGDRRSDQLRAATEEKFGAVKTAVSADGKTTLDLGATDAAGNRVYTVDASNHVVDASGKQVGTAFNKYTLLPGADGETNVFRTLPPGSQGPMQLAGTIETGDTHVGGVGQNDSNYLKATNSVAYGDQPSPQAGTSGGTAFTQDQVGQQRVEAAQKFKLPAEDNAKSAAASGGEGKPEVKPGGESGKGSGEGAGNTGQTGKSEDASDLNKMLKEKTLDNTKQMTGEQSSGSGKSGSGADGGGDNGSTARHQAAQNTQNQNVANAQPKTTAAINKGASGLSHETGTAVNPNDVNTAKPPTPPGGPQAASAPAPTSGTETGPGSVEEEMKKLFG